MHQQLLREIEKRQAELIEVCQQLIRCRSPNPPGDTREVASFIASYLEGVGLEVDWVVAQPEMPNLIAQLTGLGRGRHLTLIGHMDTFPVPHADEWQYDPFGGEIADGRIYGRGASDMKGGLAASMLAMAVLAQFRNETRGQIDFLAVSAEEDFGWQGAPYLLAQRPSLVGDAAITAEPLYDGVIGCGEKGMVWLEVVAHSAGGGGFLAGSGESAVELLLFAIEELQEFRSWRCDLPARLVGAAGENRPTLERVTVNVGLIQGGSKINLRPQLARAEIDIRLPLGIGGERVLGRVNRLLKESQGLSWRLIQQSEPNWSDPDDRLFNCLAKAAFSVEGCRFPIGMYLPASDARLFRQLGIPAASFGPPAHGEGCPDEYVLTSDLIATAKILTLTAFDYNRYVDVS